MSFQQRVASHPMLSLVAAIFAVVSATAGIQRYFHTQQISRIASEHTTSTARLCQQHEHREAELRRQLSTIRWRIGDETEAFDVRKLLVTPHTANRLDGSDLYDHDGFYARRMDTDDGWIYGQTTELQVAAYTQAVGVETFRKQLAPQIAEAAEAIPLHIWRHRDTYNVNDGDVLSRFFPAILVQRLSHSDFSGLMQTSTSESQAHPALERPVSTTADSPQPTAVSDVLEAAYRGDATGVMLTTQLLLEIGTAQPNGYTTRLNLVEKKGNVVYAQIESIFRDVDVNGTLERQFFLLRDLILISTPTDVYLVKTMIPSTDQRSPHRQWISGWLGDFGVRVDDWWQH